MTELLVPPEVEDEEFREHYQELIRATLLRAVEAGAPPKGRRGRRRAEESAALLGAPPPAPVAPPPLVAAALPPAEAPVAPSPPTPPPPVATPEPEHAPAPAPPSAASWLVVPAVEPDERGLRSRLLTATRVVWVVAVVLLVCDAIAFGPASWASGLADLGVVVIPVVWFVLSSENARARRAAAAPEPDVASEPAPGADGIQGLGVVPLAMGRDAGGHITDLITNGALDPLGPPPAHWQMVSCRAGTLRGMHARVSGDDLRIVVQGRAALGLKDLRPGSPSEGRSELLSLSGDDYAAVVIPAGVAHGVFAETDALVLVAGQADDGEEHGCTWNDPGLGITWPAEPRFLSERDRKAGPLEVLATEVAALLRR